MWDLNPQPGPCSEPENFHLIKKACVLTAKVRPGRQVLLALWAALLTSSPGRANAVTRASAPDHPFVYRLRGEYRIALPEAMQRRLDQSVPGFVPWREADYMPVIRQTYKFSWQQAPFAVVGDLNGDHLSDVALAGHTAQATLLLVILSQGLASPHRQVPSGYRVVVVDQGGLVGPAQMGSKNGPAAEKGLGAFLSYVAPGTYTSGYEKGPLHLKQGAFEEVFYGKAAGIYAWNGKAFGWYVTGD